MGIRESDIDPHALPAACCLLVVLLTSPRSYSHVCRHWREALAPPCLERLLGLYPLQPMVTTGRGLCLLLFPRALLEAEEDKEEGDGGVRAATRAFERTQVCIFLCMHARILDTCSHLVDQTHACMHACTHTWLGSFVHQASLAALCCVALKWCPLPTHERLVPRLLQVKSDVCIYVCIFG